MPILVRLFAFFFIKNWSKWYWKLGTFPKTKSWTYGEYLKAKRQVKFSTRSFLIPFEFRVSSGGRNFDLPTFYLGFAFVGTVSLISSFSHVKCFIILLYNYTKFLTTDLLNQIKLTFKNSKYFGHKKFFSKIYIFSKIVNFLMHWNAREWNLYLFHALRNTVLNKRFRHLLQVGFYAFWYE